MEVPQSMILSAERFKYWIIDRPGRQIRIIHQDGEELTVPIAGDDPILDSEVDLSIFDWERWWISSITKRRDFVVAEGYSPFTKDPLHGRPVVYLDQNHWRTLAQARIDPREIRKRSEVQPALEILRLALDGGIVTPLSSAYLRETAPLYGDRRNAVGIAMAQLAGGWQMRHPNRVWGNEAVRMVASELNLDIPAEAHLPVITLEPHALLADDVDAYKMDTKGLELFILAATGPSIILDLLLHPKRDDAVPIAGWVQRNQEITDSISLSDMPKAKKIRAALACFWRDSAETVQTALSVLGQDPEALSRLSWEAVADMYAGQPMLGLPSQSTLCSALHQ